MNRLVLLAVAGTIATAAHSQQQQQADTSWKKEYRASATRINDLVHTRLDVRPDYSNSHLYGKAWITLQPHFYATDSLSLDAKGMEIKKVSLYSNGKEQPLKYTYDDFTIRISLGKTYKAGQSYTVYVEYTAKPDEFEEKYARNQMLGIKGLYFINPKGEEKDKPTQIWTQGETESNSAWFPTIDATNQRCTQEITITVPEKYVTLSNGKLVSQKKNADKTRSDYWKMELPHAPYLFFMGVGEYTVVKDSWRGKEVNYYVEPEYGPVARKIFGNTPEMMTFFSKITGVDFPWIKYSQITGRDYVAGAMENTTATIHQNFAQQDARELIDGNSWEGTIAHELFHQWFGDYVTTESWSNLTLNESFADYSQTLWSEYKEGKDAGDAENFQGLQGYLRSGSGEKNLVRFYYPDREDMFDAVSYQKGGRILHMLRYLVGDDAFYKAINLYLTTNKFKSAEAHQLRLSFEEVTGRDLNWFFNQWYFGNGNPDVEISYLYDDAAGKVTVIVKQVQPGGKTFRLPLAVDMYNGTTKKRYDVWASNAVDSFSFPYSTRPDLVNVDAEKVMLWTKKDDKTADNFLHQFRVAGNYMDRREAIEYFVSKPYEQKTTELLKLALNDKYSGIRSLALSKVDLSNAVQRTALEPVVAKLAKSDPQSTVRAGAIRTLGETGDKQYLDLYRKGMSDSSYSVAGASLEALSVLDPSASLTAAKELRKQTNKGWLKESIMLVMAKSGDEETFDELLSNFTSLDLQSRFGEVQNLVVYLQSIRNTEKFKKGVDELLAFKEAIPPALKERTDPYLSQMLNSILTAKQQASKADPSNAALKDQATYIAGKLNKKAF
ncbi:MAG: M1 family peptidase [Chitinophagaceae bacterium]|nr:MAG: M1 family peptidase [Chitinophagaceae bacterium]